MDVLIPVKYLIDGNSVFQVPVNEVTYYHVELPQHSVLLAEGLPVESYLRHRRPLELCQWRGTDAAVPRLCNTIA